jgi:glycine betaine/choline ABC-type transport system substrate-binding protein
MPSLRPLAAPAAVLACLALGSCGSGGDSSASGGGAPIERGPGSGRSVVEMAYTPSSEQRVLAQVYAQALKHAGFRVRLAKGVGAGGPGVVALEHGRVNAYPRFARVLGPERRQLDAQGVTVLPPGRPVRAFGLAVLARTARHFHLDRISDVRDHASSLALAVPRDCQRDPACLPALRRAYGLRFRRARAVRPDLMHEALRTGRYQVSLVATTDPHVRRSGETLLMDDRHAFPAAPPVMLVRKPLARRGGATLSDAVDKAGSGLTVEVMEELNARVDFDEESPGRAARDYLKAAGLL